MNIKTFNQSRELKKILKSYSLDLATIIHTHQQKVEKSYTEDFYLKEVEKFMEKYVNEIQGLYHVQPYLIRNIHKRYFVNKNIAKFNFSEED